MSRVCRSLNVDPSVTMYCSVLTSVLSIVGSYTSDSTPSATVYQTLDPVPAAVPRQSFRARSKYDGAPGPPGATPAARADAAVAVIAAGAATPSPAITATAAANRGKPRTLTGSLITTSSPARAAPLRPKRDPQMLTHTKEADNRPG
jgi:hypothetical protein